MLNDRLPLAAWPPGRLAAWPPGRLALAAWPLAAGRWPLAAGRWPLAAGRWPLAMLMGGEGTGKIFKVTGAPNPQKK